MEHHCVIVTPGVTPVRVFGVSFSKNTPLRPDKLNLEQGDPGWVKVTSSVWPGADDLTCTITHGHLVMMNKTIAAYLRQVEGANELVATFLNEHDQAD